MVAAGAAVALTAVAGRAADPPAGGLAARLRAAGRATVSFERRAYDPMADTVRTEAGRLSLEVGRADVRFTRTGERLTVRPDGGEWLQPELEQLLVLGPGGVAVARHWWEALLAPGRETIRRGNEIVIAGPAGGADADSAHVRLGADGLPQTLEIVEVTGRTSYRFSKWRFGSAKGRAAFVQKAPPGVETVRME